MTLLRLALRNAFRNRRRSLVTVAAMALALFFMVLYAGLSVGYLHHMRQNVLDLELGELQVTTRTYANDPSLYDVMDDGEAVLERIERAGFPAAGRLSAVALVAAEATSAAAAIRGVDPARDRTVSRLADHVQRGSFLHDEADGGAVLGRRLARTLGVGPGDEVVLLGQAADGSSADRVLPVRGVLAAITDEVDRGGVYVSQRVFRDLFAVPRGFHRIIVRTPDGVDLDDARRTVAALAVPHAVRTFRDLAPQLASMVDSMQAALYFMYAIVYVAIGIVLTNTMLMAVFERIREFGVLKAVGMGPWSVLAVVLGETAMLTFVAAAVGLLASLPALAALVRWGIDLSSLQGDLSLAGVALDPIWRARVTPDVFAGPTVSFFAISLLAALYPAAKAASITPVAAMRHT